MIVYRDINTLPSFKNTVITIGSFDGIHQGHLSILHSLTKHAKATNGISILITFEPHPRKLIFPNTSLKLLTSLEEKIELLKKTDLDALVIVPFTKEFAAMEAESYIERFLVHKFKPQTIIIGYDHRFGHDRSGDFNMLKQYASKYHYQVLEISAEKIDHAAVSSSKIRQSIENGNIHLATQMLGRYYSVQGEVVKGKQLGRTINYPTANLCISNMDKLIPKIGVYVGFLKIDNSVYESMISIGINPTVTDSKNLKIEAHIFDFNQEIYSKYVSLYFGSKLRDEIKFDSLDALKNQIMQDEIESKKWLASFRI